jgi:hypothetical protein
MKYTIKEFKSAIEMELPLITYKRGDVFISYCPVLKLMTYSQDETKLESYFEEVLDHFFATQKDKNLIQETILNLGLDY